ncbi:MAG: site-2 protease family protein [Clostridia bacterium]|nr:site-2 protease family protein [Clostridia bacterium]
MGIFSILNSGLPFTEMLLFFVAWIIAVVVAICAHEFSHAVVAVKMGDLTPKMAGRLTLNPFAHFDALGFIFMLLLGFGWAKPVPIQSRNFRNIKKGEIWVSLAGILTNLALCVIFSFFCALVIGLFNIELTIWLFIARVFMFSAFINFALAIFNLIPIPPLDGFNFISALCRYENKFIQFVRQNSLILMLIVLMLIMFTDIMGIFVDLVVGNLIALFTMIF